MQTNTAQTGTAPTTLPTVRPGAYRIDPARSEVRFTAAHFFGVKPVPGTLAVTSGSLVVAHDPRRSTVTVELDPASFTTDDPRRDADITGKRFLNAAAYPVMGFRGTSVVPDGDGWRLDGVLTVRGTDSPVALRLTGAEPAGERAGAWRFSATARIDRYAAGVTMARGFLFRWVDVDLEVVAVPSATGGPGLRP
jgi:polyisoprenoid-binding protein YceI